MNQWMRFFLYGFILMGIISCDTIKSWLNQSKSTTNNTQKETDVEVSWEQKNLDYLEKNKNQSGVEVTSSGLQYKVIKEGKGDSPKATSQVEVHYRGTLIDGQEFDSSYKRNQTATFGLNQVIPGWTEGLQLMKEGATYEFYIPSRLAYGDRAVSTIPGGSTLIFQVELVKIVSL